MQVLKFGGTSVANAKNITNVVEIVTKALERDRTLVVSSAISGCTDKLINIGHLAAQRNEEYKVLIDDLQQKHYEIISDLLPAERQTEARSKVDEVFD